MKLLTKTVLVTLLIATGSTASAVSPWLLAQTAGVQFEDRQALQEFATCLIRRSRGAVESYLQFAPDAREGRKPAQKMIARPCEFNGRMEFSSPLLRGALVEALYREDFSRNENYDLKAIAKIDYAADFDRRDPDAVAAHVARVEFADCAVRGDAVAARAILQTNVGGVSEAMAFNALRPAMAGCIGQGASFSGTRAALRGLIAESIYRLAKQHDNHSSIVKGG